MVYNSNWYHHFLRFARSCCYFLYLSNSLLLIAFSYKLSPEIMLFFFKFMAIREESGLFLNKNLFVCRFLRYLIPKMKRDAEIQEISVKILTFSLNLHCKNNLFLPCFQRLFLNIKLSAYKLNRKWVCLSHNFIFIDITA